MGAAASEIAAPEGGGASKSGKRAVEDGTLKFAAALAAIASATTAEELHVVVKDVTAAHVEHLSAAQAKDAFDALVAALAAVDPATTDSVVKALRALAGGDKPATVRLLVKRVVALRAASSYMPVEGAVKCLQNLLAARRDHGLGGGGGGGGGLGGGGGGGGGGVGGGGGGGGSGRFLRGRLPPSAIMTPYAFAVQGGDKTAAIASQAAMKDRHGNIVGAEFDFAKTGALKGTRVGVLVGTYELEPTSTSPVFHVFADKGIECTKCVLRCTGYLFSLRTPHLVHGTPMVRYCNANRVSYLRDMSYLCLTVHAPHSIHGTCGRACLNFCLCKVQQRVYTFNFFSSLYVVSILQVCLRRVCRPAFHRPPDACHRLAQIAG